MSETFDENPYDRWGLDPTAGPEELTAQLRQLAESARDEATRRAVRDAWEQLTRHPRQRLAAAARAHPSERSTSEPSPSPPARVTALERPFAPIDFALPPRLTGTDDGEADPFIDLPPADDPHL